MIRKVVIPAAGLGTRLLPATKELPKEMLPIFSKGKKGIIHLKPILQEVFEQLFDVGFREFCFVVGRGKRAIEDHFTPDFESIRYLENKNREMITDELQNFYNKIEDSSIAFIRQPRPKGFGDAVSKAEPFTFDEPFLVHAGDDFVFSNGGDHLKRIMRTSESYNASVVLLVERVKDARMYGVVTKSKKLDAKLYQVMEVIEKPDKPPTNLATIGISVYKPVIYTALKNVEPDNHNELQLTAAVQKLIEDGHKILAVELEFYERRIDIGGPEKYYESLKVSFEVMNSSLIRSRRASVENR